MIVTVGIISLVLCLNSQVVNCASHYDKTPVFARDTTTETNVCPPTGIQFVTAPGSCIDFFICRSGTIFSQQCADGLNFDSEILKCNDNICFRDLCSVENDKGQLQFEQKEDCSSSYFICDSGHPIEQNCADNLFWNQEKTQCTVDCISPLIQ